VVLDDRRVLTGAWWGVLTIWDIETGEELLAFKEQHPLGRTALLAGAPRIFSGRRCDEFGIDKDAINTGA
jgi:hypothetical protein